MSNEEINKTYNKFRKVNSYSGDLRVLTSLTHFFLMDASYDNFNKTVRTLPLKHQAKQIAAKMSRTYDAFFTKFFAPFDLEQREYLGDKSDELRAHIANDVERCRLAMMDCCDDEDLDAQIKIANLWLCNKFASEAQHFYQRTWKKSGFKMYGILYTKNDTDKDIDAILKHTLDLTALLYGNGESVSEKHYDKFIACADTLTRKIANWINQDYQEEIKKNE